MSKQYPGGLIIKNPVTPTGPYQSGTASGVWTLAEQAYWTKQGLWPTAGLSPSEVYFKYVTMLLHGNGAASGSTTVLPFNSDASTNAFNVTIVGDTKSNNFTPYQEGYYSNYFDGTGDYLNATANAAFDFGTGDCAVEAWVYATAYPTTSQIFSVFPTSGGGGTGYGFSIQTSGYISFECYISGTQQFITATTNAVALNTWTHVAYTRSSGTSRLFVNGISCTFTGSISQAINGGSNVPKVGYLGYTGFLNPFNGYISNLRVVKGSAVYTSNFTPSTTPLTAISGTSLLTCQSNRFIDNSTNAFTLTVNGNTAVAPAQPFTLPSSVATYGSGYFDGSGDYLQTTLLSSAFSFGTGDFALSAWIYPTTVSGIQSIIDLRTSSNLSAPVLYLNGAVLTAAKNDQINVLSGGTVIANAWNFTELTRTSGSWRLFINGTLVAGPTTDTINYTTNQLAFIGIVGINATYPFSGYMTDVRVLKGTGGATSTLPTTPLTAVSGTSLLTTQYNGGANNNGFKDSSQNNFPITRNGNTTQGTFSPYGSNWSNYFTGANSLSFATNAAFSLNSSAFTIEAWVNLNSVSGDRAVTSTYGGSTTGWSLQFQSGILYFYRAGDTIGITGTTAISAGVWNHIAVSGTAGSSIKMFINGVQQGSTSTGNITDSSTALSVGQLFNVNYLAGYVSNLRLVKGTALYTANFTPPTSPLTAVSGTSLLTCQSNRFIDRSANAFTCSLNGSPTIQRISPFAPTEPYSTSVIGGSGYFDGSGDWLSVADVSALQFGTGAFTVECWAYFQSLSAAPIFDQRASGPSTNAFVIYADTSGYLSFYCFSPSVSLTSNLQVKANSWNHIAFVRSGNAGTFYLNGVAASSTVNLASYNNTSSANRIFQAFDPAYVTGYCTDFRVVKGTAVYTTAFTPPTAPLTAITNTSLLLSYTNAGIFDNSEITNVETVGNAMASTSIYKYGTGSLYFDGSGDYLQMPLNNTFNFGTNSFTIEMWVNPATTNHQSACFFTQEHISASNTPISICIYLNGGNYEVVGNGLGWGIYSGGAWQVSQFNLATIPINTWTFIALVRNGNVFTMYVNGTSVGSVTYSGSCSVGSTQYFIGRRWDLAGSYPYFNGNVDDFRLTLGIARYTANFTPPTSQFFDQ